MDTYFENAVTALLSRERAFALSGVFNKEGSIPTHRRTWWQRLRLKCRLARRRRRQNH